MAYIYVITNQINGKQYVGKTLNAVEARFKEHCKDSKRERCKDRPLYRAFNKYGIDNFNVIMLEECSDKIVNDREIYWIDKLNTYHNGYNATLGGDGKSYIDYDLVVKTYSQLNNMAAVARELHICVDTVTKILKERHIPLKSSVLINREQNGKAVNMYNKDGQFLQSFETTSDAAHFLINNNYTKCKFSTIRYHITEVCTGKRKTTAGFKWSWK